MLLSSSQWNPAPEELVLPTNTVHLWLTGLEAPEELHRQFLESLSPDEHQRAEKFMFEQHRIHYINGRGILRMLLGRYLRLAPSQIRFIYGTQGKPGLELQHLPNTLYFNLSHSNGKALFAFARNSEIGVDIEFIRNQTDIEQSADFVFAAAEMEVLRAAAPEKQRHLFFQFWTRKEAFIKALGKGFSLPLRLVNVSSTPDHPVDISGEITGDWALDDWYIRDIHLPAGYTAALALPGRQWTLQGFMLPDFYPF